MLLKVESYSGYKADERPLRFTFLATAAEGSEQRKETEPSGGKTFEVREILDQWYGVGYQCFKVRADDNNLYILRHNLEEDCWTLDSFRREQS